MGRPTKAPSAFTSGGRAIIATAVASLVVLILAPVPAAAVAAAPRVYEMVTPPFKVIRAAVAPGALVRNNPNIGIASLDGEAMAWTTPFFALADDVGAPGVGDRRIIRRTPQGWFSETMNTLKFLDSQPTLMRQTVNASSGDLRTLAWGNREGSQNGGALLPYEGFTQNRIYTRRTGTGVEGFTPWLTNPDRQYVRFGFGQEGGALGADVAVFDDDGTAMGRSGYYRGLAGDAGTTVDDDPSDEQQLPNLAGGTTTYLQRAATPMAMPAAPQDLVNACTGSGADSTLIPARIGSGLATDTIGTQVCMESAGSPAATGTGTMNHGSTSITAVDTESGTFEVGHVISGVGIPPGTRITTVGPETLTLSAAASTGATAFAEATGGSPVLTEVSPSDSGEFRPGQTISGPVLPAGTTIVAVGEGTLTLSAPASFTYHDQKYIATGPASLPAVALSATPQHVTSQRGGRVGGSSMSVNGGTSMSMATDSTQATAMSDDGSRIFFQSPDQRAAGGMKVSCSSATGPFTDCVPQLYVRQHKPNGEAVVRWISRAQGVGTQQVGMLGAGANFQGASRDGRYVYFKTNAPLLPDDPNGGNSITVGAASNNSWDLYRYELPVDLDDDPANGTLTRISGGPSGTADPSTNGTSGGSSPLRFHSDDGKRAYFLTTSPIADADATPPTGGGTTPGGGVAIRNLYLFDDNESGADRYKFVAQISSGGCAGSGGIVRYQIFYSGYERQPGADANCFYGTPDGRYVTFYTRSGLTVDDSDGSGDIYLYDAVEDELVRVTKPLPGSSPYRCQGGVSAPLAEADSCFGDFSTAGNWGAGAIGAAGEYEAARGWGGMRYSNIAVDAHGVVSVFFESQSRLVPEDVNGDYFDVYEWRNGELSLVSPGNTDDDAWFSGNSKDGEDVFFYTSQRIDPREIDPADFDIYDARRGGGIPYHPPPVACDVLALRCEGEAHPAERPRGAASTSFAGGGNAVPAGRSKKKRCAKRKVRRGGRCVKRARHAGRRAGKQRGRR